MNGVSGNLKEFCQVYFQTNHPVRQLVMLQDIRVKFTQDTKAHAACFQGGAAAGVEAWVGGLRPELDRPGTDPAKNLSRIPFRK